MASTLTELLYHCIWSTKNREPNIHQSVEDSVWKIIVGAASHNEMHALKVGGIENHVHALVQIPKTMSVSMKRLKGGASKEINRSGIIPTGRFEWQGGDMRLLAFQSQLFRKSVDISGISENITPVFRSKMNWFSFLSVTRLTMIRNIFGGNKPSVPDGRVDSGLPGIEIPGWNEWSLCDPGHRVGRQNVEGRNQESPFVALCGNFFARGIATRQRIVLHSRYG